MPDSLPALEADRAKLVKEFLGLGDFPAGLITTVVRRCGKPACHCARPKDCGHDAQFKLTRRVAGKTATESIRNPTTLHKAQQEVTEFQRSQNPGEQLVALNERICPLRPVQPRRRGWTAQKKFAVLHQEMAQEIQA